MNPFGRFPLACLLVFASLSAHAEEGGPPDLLPTLGSIERLDPRLDALVPRDAVIEVLASGFEWAEGPVWLKDQQAILFSDIPRNRVMRFKDGEGLSVFLDPAGFTGRPGSYGGECGSNGLTLLCDTMTRPNGICLSPDETRLYVAQSDPQAPIWKVFNVKPDGTLDEGRMFFDGTKLFKERKKGLPDGLKVDLAGNVFATGPGGVLVFAADGTHLGTFLTGQATANCGFGGDGRTLYMTADSHLCRARLTTKGPLPGP